MSPLIKHSLAGFSDIFLFKKIVYIKCLKSKQNKLQKDIFVVMLEEHACIIYLTVKY